MSWCRLFSGSLFFLLELHLIICGFRKSILKTAPFNRRGHNNDMIMTLFLFMESFSWCFLGFGLLRNPSWHSSWTPPTWAALMHLTCATHHSIISKKYPQIPRSKQCFCVMETENTQKKINHLSTLDSTSLTRACGRSSWQLRFTLQHLWPLMAWPKPRVSG